MKGEVKKEEQKQCFYGADGKVQRRHCPALPRHNNSNPSRFPVCR
jgi:hypothetical protein